LIVNLKTAKTPGLTIPEAFVQTADQVTECVFAALHESAFGSRKCGSASVMARRSHSKTARGSETNALTEFV
jgi:hypothetical protein